MYLALHVGFTVFAWSLYICECANSNDDVNVQKELSVRGSSYVEAAGVSLFF